MKPRGNLNARMLGIRWDKMTNLKPLGLISSACLLVIATGMAFLTTAPRIYLGEYSLFAALIFAYFFCVAGAFYILGGLLLRYGVDVNREIGW